MQKKLKKIINTVKSYDFLKVDEDDIGQLETFNAIYMQTWSKKIYSCTFLHLEMYLSTFLEF